MSQIHEEGQTFYERFATNGTGTDRINAEDGAVSVITRLAGHADD